MTSDILLENGYKYFEKEHARNCDRFYQKKINENKCINVYYYDTFKDNGALDYNFEYELYDEHEDYVKTTYVYGLDKDAPYTIEEIEKLLLVNNMSEEIKEILKILKEYADGSTSMYPSIKLVTQLLDYITTIQQQYDEAVNQSIVDHKYASQKEDEVIELQQENERLKAINNEYERLNKREDRCFKIIDVQELSSLSTHSHYIDELLNKLEDYKSRNEKAIEYVKHDLAKYINPSDLLHILQGSDSNDL